MGILFAALSRDNQGRAALHVAAEGGHGAIARLRLSHGADVNDCKRTDQERGWSPLRSAAIGGHLGVMRILLEQGADPMIPAEGEA